MAAYIDDGHAGTYADMLANSPCLDVREYPDHGGSNGAAGQVRNRRERSVP